MPELELKSCLFRQYESINFLFTYMIYL